MAKSKNVTTKKKRPAKKKSSRKKQSQSLLPALLFLGLAAGLIAVLYLFFGHCPPPAKPDSQRKTASQSEAKKLPPKKPIAEIEKKSSPDSTAPTTTESSHLTIYRLSLDFSRTLSFVIPCKPDLTRTEKARRIIHYLTLPGERDQPPLPRSTRLRSASFKAPLITIDLSGDVRKDLINSGANDEILTVACLTHSLLASFPGFKTLQILIDGEKQKTLAGHIDISSPLKYQ